jgi:hypothetical protein
MPTSPLRSSVVLTALVAIGSSLAAQTPIPQWKDCRPGTKVDPNTLLSRSMHALGIDAAVDHVLHF